MSARPVFDLVRERYLEIAEGCRLADSLREFRYPTPLDVSGQDLVHVGRIRRDLTDENGLVFWCCGDQPRKGAATNAVQIAELLFGRTRPPQIPDPETGPVRRDAGSGRMVFRRAGESGGTS